MLLLGGSGDRIRTCYLRVMKWLAPPEHPELRRAEAHVRRIRLDRPAALVRRLRGELSSDMAVEVKKKSHSRKKTCAWESKICVSRVRSVTSRYALRPAGRTSSHCDYSYSGKAAEHERS